MDNEDLKLNIPKGLPITKEMVDILIKIMKDLELFKEVNPDINTTYIAGVNYGATQAMYLLKKGEK